MGAAVMLEGVKAPAQRASLARLTAALVCVLAAAVGMLVATPTPAMAATYAYDTVSYVYDAPTRSSSSDTVATDAQGSPSGPGATSWETSVSVAGDVVAANTVPTRLARVVSEEFGGAPTLGRPGTPDVFVTAADDLAGISTSSGIAERVTLLSPGGKPISGPFRVLEFDTPAGIASPIRRTNPGFIGGGQTAGGAREFVIPNYSTDSLVNLTTRTVN